MRALLISTGLLSIQFLEHIGPIAVSQLIQTEAWSVCSTIFVHCHDKLAASCAVTPAHLLKVYEAAQVELTFDLLIVVRHDLRLELVSHLLVSRHDPAPWTPSNEPASALGDRAINKLAALIESKTVGANDGRVLVSNRELLLTVEIVANLEHAVVNE